MNENDISMTRLSAPDDIEVRRKYGDRWMQGFDISRGLQSEGTVTIMDSSSYNCTGGVIEAAIFMQFHDGKDTYRNFRARNIHFQHTQAVTDCVRRFARGLLGKYIFRIECDSKTVGHVRVHNSAKDGKEAILIEWDDGMESEQVRRPYELVQIPYDNNVESVQEAVRQFVHALFPNSLPTATTPTN